MMDPQAVLYAAIASVIYLVLSALLVVIPVALVLVPIAAAAGALGTIGILVMSLVAGEAKHEIPADDGSVPDAAHTVAGVDPAWPHYLAGQASNDALAAVKAVIDAVERMWERIGSMGDRFAVADPRTRVVVLPLMVLMYLAGVAALLGAGAGAVIGGVVTCGAAGVLWVVRVSGVALVRLVDRAQLRRAGSGATCTAPGCFGFTQLPTVECGCGRLHIQLLPGHYGVLRRWCTCGAAIPSTVSRAASSSLLSLRCPWCRRRLLPGAMRDTDIRVAVIGASGAGKTSFAGAALGAVRTAVVGAGGAFDIYGSGTPDEPGARCTSARIIIDRRRATLHLFDAPGRILDDQLQRIRLYYLRDAQGFALVIDPAAVPWLADRLPNESGESTAADPELAYQAVITQLQDSGIPLKRRSLAVVLNKSDQLEAASDDCAPGAGSDRVRKWLSAHGQDNLVKAADRDFGRVRYFVVTSVGDESVSAGIALRWLVRRSGLPLPALG